MTMPRPLLRDRAALPLYDAAATARIERRAAAALPAHELMARAGRALARLARAVAPHARTAWIAAGPGNNGGDGLVLATHLRAAGLDVRVSLVGHAAGKALPDDAAWALAQAQAAGVALAAALPDADARFDLVVDALFGVGQRRAVEGDFAAAVARLNAAAAPRLAVDLPTGLATDTGAALGEHVVRATHTLTLLTAKPGLFTGAGREFAGESWLDDLGVAPGAGDAPVALLAGAADAGALLPPRAHLAHKGSFGDVRIAGGAAGMVGAALLAARAASRAGAGRVLAHARAFDAFDAGGALAVDPGHPELMLRPFAELADAVRDDARATVVAGCGGGADVAAALPALLARAARLVLDADALNAVAHDDRLRAQLAARGRAGRPTILTPHPLEAARLLRVNAADVQASRLAAARELADETRAVVVLKGSGTIVATPDGAVVVNPTGDARLATAGTGDVLAGWTGGLWAAQGRDDGDGVPFVLARRVAVAAAYVHGQACAHAAGTRLPLVASALVDAMAAAAEALRR